MGSIRVNPIVNGKRRVAAKNRGMTLQNGKDDAITEVAEGLTKNQETLKEEQRRMILEMINASWDLAEKLGKHPVTASCNCIACVNGRKRIIDKSVELWEFEL
jgi:hypothetical protein